jgi:hyperosmotically inducible periplasmic protein
MIRSRPRFALLLAGTAVCIATACASTPTQKTAGEQIDDTVVTAQVKAALIGDPVTKARDIDVEVFKGRVQLNGFVDSAAERSQATTVASRVTGVAAVDNNLKLKGAERTAGKVIDDAAISGTVKTNLAADDRTKAHQINVETRDAVVLLAGFVSSAAERSAATEIAGSVAGVKSVDNRIALK